MASAFTPPPVNRILTDPVAYASMRQWQVATGGFIVTIGGVDRFFATDETSQALITGKALRIEQPNPPTNISWLFPDGFADIPASDFKAAAIKVADFVQATFDKLRAVIADIQAGYIKTVADVDAVTWPAPRG